MPEKVLLLGLPARHIMIAGQQHLGCMAGGFDCIGSIEGVVGEGHVQKVSLGGLAQLCHPHLHSTWCSGKLHGRSVW